jgi:mono/diheme cytochrome c family protein
MLSIRKHHAGLAWAAVLLLSLAWAVPTLAQEGTDEETIAEGAQLYSENCAVCHGAEGNGRVGATLAQDWPSIRPDLRVKDAIENGISGSVMPAWSQENGGPLAESDVNDLVAFILTWSTPDNPPSVPGEAEQAPAAQIDPQVWIFFGILAAIVVGAVVVSLLGRRR